MLFQTPEFGFLFLATLVAFYIFAKRFRLEVIALSSLIFYAASGIFDFALLISTVLVTYFLSRFVRPGGGRWPIYAAVLILLGSLGYFKYSEFFYENLRGVLGDGQWAERPAFLTAILPLGISFYTFQIVGYFIDIYKGRTARAQNLLQYLVFVTFMAQLIAGPIMRGRDYLPQLQNLRGATQAEFWSGVQLILLGLVKKVVLADFIADFVDTRFAADSFTQPEAWIAAALFGFQIYFDFSGYVDIALGIGRMLGIKLRQNFLTPYLSRSPSEFWQRWHITLSEWFRDYIYIPLGGNRNGRAREVFNLLLVMAVAGLWHGAGWTFVLWGIMHGAMLAAQRFVPSGFLQSIMPVPQQYKSYAYHMLALVVIFNTVMLAWIPFRADSLATTLEMYQAIVTFKGFGSWISEIKWIGIVGILFAMHVAERWVRENYTTAFGYWGRVPSVARGFAYGSLGLAIVIFSGNEQSFIYFRF